MRMNVIFSIVFVLACVVALVRAPDLFLSTVLDGASKSAALCFSLIATYAVWLGLMNVWKDSGLTQVLSKALKPITRKIFKTNDRETLDCLCMNLSVNLLGISGAATPYGINGVRLLDKSDTSEYSSAMFFVVNATSIQLIPTSIIGVRVALGSVAPASIVLPTFLSSCFSTVLAMTLVRILIPPTPVVSRLQNAEKTRFFSKTAGAGMR